MAPTTKQPQPDDPIDVIALIRGNVRWIFLYTPESVPALYDYFERYAADPQCCFTWGDAWVLREKVRRALRDGAEVQQP